jgi:hypothetical protein
MGPWKLIHYYGNAAEPELYNIETDVLEQAKVAFDYPERAERMQLMLEKHLNEVEACASRSLSRSIPLFCFFCFACYPLLL